MAIINGTELNDILTALNVDINGIGDEIYGLGGNDKITGFLGSDKLFGGAGHDTIYGMDGHDTMDGGAGNDRLFGGNGNDGMVGGTGDDYLNGELGYDAVDYRGVTGTRGVTVDLRITKAQDTKADGYDTIVNVEQVWGVQTSMIRSPARTATMIFMASMAATLSTALAATTISLVDSEKPQVTLCPVVMAMTAFSPRMVQTR
ncbi:MAG: calcium-binding protein [Nitrosomonas sp.]